MTANDKRLIEFAETLDYTEYGKIDELIMLSDTREAKERLREIEIRLYHQEEASIGNI